MIKQVGDGIAVGARVEGDVGACVAGRIEVKWQEKPNDLQQKHRKLETPTFIQPTCQKIFFSSAF